MDHQHDEMQYLDSIRNVLTTTTTSQPHQTGITTKSYPGLLTHTYNLSGDEVPLFTTRRVPFTLVLTALLSFIKSATPAKQLVFRTLIEKLKLNPSSPPHGFDIWRLLNNIDVLPPGEVKVYFYINPDETLSMTVWQQTGDLGPGGVPRDVAFYGILYCMIAHLLNRNSYQLTHIVVNAKMYSVHEDELRKQADRNPRPFPQLIIKKRGQQQLMDFVADDFQLVGYDPHPEMVGNEEECWNDAAASELNADGDWGDDNAVASTWAEEDWAADELNTPDWANSAANCPPSTESKTALEYYCPIQANGIYWCIMCKCIIKKQTKALKHALMHARSE